VRGWGYSSPTPPFLHVLQLTIDKLGTTAAVLAGPADAFFFAENIYYLLKLCTKDKRPNILFAWYNIVVVFK